jgi:hypothetical protein
MSLLSQDEDIGITVAILAAEVAGALASGSPTLLAGAGHVLTAPPTSGCPWWRSGSGGGHT